MSSHSQCCSYFYFINFCCSCIAVLLLRRAIIYNLVAFVCSISDYQQQYELETGDKKITDTPTFAGEYCRIQD